jgi:general secretion pathway protein D
MRDADSANKLSVDRYEQMRGMQKTAQPAESYVTPINEAPVMPAPPPASAASAASAPLEPAAPASEPAKAP